MLQVLWRTLHVCYKGPEGPCITNHTLITTRYLQRVELMKHWLPGMVYHTVDGDKSPPTCLVYALLSLSITIPRYPNHTSAARIEMKCFLSSVYGENQLKFCKGDLEIFLSGTNAFTAHPFSFLE
jgi:hypothetical protein